MYLPLHISSPEDPYASLREELEEGTTDKGYFDIALAGEELKKDNENFAYALFEIMDTKEKAKMYAELSVPPSSDPRHMQLMASMMYALPANYMNISLRQEMVRVALAQELQKGTDPGKIGASGHIGGARLGSMLSDFFKKVEDTFGRFVDSLSDFFQKVGRTIGLGLRALGRNVLTFRQAMIKLGGPAMRYVTDFLILTPGVKFLFGDLSHELGYAITEGQPVRWMPIAAGYSQYLKDMALILNTTSNFLPAPWNVIAKVVAAVYKAGAGLIDWQVAEKIKELMKAAAEANAKIRQLVEASLYEAFGSLGGAMQAAGAMEKSEYGANTPTEPTGGLRLGGVLMIGILGAAAMVLLLGGK